jgi:putative FmdB family regulatory protein
MPTYEYACGACAHQWEESQRITAAPTEVCPKCGKPDAHRLISAGTNFILKGGGWYSDLYSSPKQAASGGDKPADAKASDKAETKSSPGEAGGGTSSTSESSSKPAAESTPAATKTPSPAAPSGS